MEIKALESSGREPVQFETSPSRVSSLLSRSGSVIDSGSKEHFQISRTTGRKIVVVPSLEGNKSEVIFESSEVARKAFDGMPKSIVQVADHDRSKSKPNSREEDATSEEGTKPEDDEEENIETLHENQGIPEPPSLHPKAHSLLVADDAWEKEETDSGTEDLDDKVESGEENVETHLRTQLQPGVIKGKGTSVHHALAHRPRSWASVLNSARSCIKLEYFDLSDNNIIDIDDDLVDDESWNNCAVGYFLGPDMAFGL
ncbi:hypothetical protein U1Q18_041620, partial [Sarracenia purpurea var. burkii]